MKRLHCEVYEINEMHQNIIFDDGAYLITSIWRRKIPHKNKRMKRRETSESGWSGADGSLFIHRNEFYRTN